MSKTGLRDAKHMTGRHHLRDESRRTRVRRLSSLV
jgi:hypothetical protein